MRTYVEDMASLNSLLLLYSTTICLVSGSHFNAALYKPAYISSEYIHLGVNILANLANDGFDDVHFLNMHCTHSLMDNPGWWIVDLRGLYSVDQIILVNR